jgi:hypothetical protein
MVQILILLALLTNLPGAQSGEARQNQSLPATPILLTESWSKALEMPSFQYGELAQCDQDGNLYFHATSSFNDSVVLKLKPSGSYAMLVLAPEDAAGTYFLAFRVSRDGRLRILTHANSGDQLYLYEFHSEDDPPKATPLQVPAGLDVLNFQALARGYIAVEGYMDKTSPNNKGKSYLGKFDPAGKLIRESFDNASYLMANESGTWAASSAAAEADDGRNYLLSGNDVIVLSADGDVIKKIHLDPPAKNYRPINIFTAGGVMAVAFFKPPEKGEETGRGFLAMYQTFDRYTGEALKLYKPSPDLGNNAVCFTKQGFTFLTVQKKHLKLVGANL